MSELPHSDAKAPRPAAVSGAVSVEDAPTGTGRQRPTIAIAIATAGRRDVLRKTLVFLNGQSRRPDEVLICPARPEDVDPQGLADYDGAVQLVAGPKGSSHQRNAMIRHSKADLMLFLDDDFLPAADYLEAATQLFAGHPDIVVATGAVIRDGAQGPGLGFEEAVAILEADAARAAEERQKDWRKNVPESGITPTFNAYGCNMVIRLDPVRRHGLGFDENLPLYAWLEDVDLSRKLAAHGRVVKADGLRGVHMGTKVGRTPGRRLGYSQVANRIYLHRKGTVSWLWAWNGIFQNLAANLAKSFAPEPWVDRRGRLAGNLLALSDLLAGRISPGNIMRF